MISETLILRHLERQPKQTAGFKQLVRELRAHGNGRRQLETLLKQMVGRGTLAESARERFSLPRAAAGKNTVSGRLSMHRDGYGFVTPEEGPARARITGDIFINPQAVGSAMDADRVVVEVTAVRSDGRAEGRIISVVGRRHATVVGTFHYGSRSNYVTPIDEKITRDIIIPRSVPLPPEEGGSEAPIHNPTAHRVLGAEATRRPRPDWSRLEGVVVDVEVTDWPAPTQNPRGRIIEVLGHEDDFGVDVEIIIRKYHLPHRFPPEVLEEAHQIPTTISVSQVAERRDFRSLPIVTIDGETARDFDDAVYARRLENGNYELQVHIADVAHYVAEFSALDEEARLRGTSVYFPDRAVPMLPVELSTDICSLRPHADRLVLSCLMQIDRHGELLEYELCEGVIRSAERMTYTDVNAVLQALPEKRPASHSSLPDDPQAAALLQRYSHLKNEFLVMLEVAQSLRHKRERRGAIDFDLPEPEIEFDQHGLMKSITRSERNAAHRLIEEFMLAANQSVASFLERKAVPSLYRIHEKPDPRRVLEFEQIAAGFGYSLGVGVLPVQRFRYTDDRRPRRRDGRGNRSGARRQEIEIPQEIAVTPRMYQTLTRKIAGTPEERILSYLMLRSLKQARYSEENTGHFALAAPVYTHFTSPIRRYPDLTVHRILKQVLQGREYANSSQESSSGQTKPAARPQEQRNAELRDIAKESSEAERRADDAERELMEWKKAKFMAARIGDEFDGLIVSVTRFGFFVELTDMFVEGLVPLSTLTDDNFVYHESTRQIIGQRSRIAYGLGQCVRVLVDRIDAVQKKIQFALVSADAARRGRRNK